MAGGSDGPGAEIDVDRRPQCARARSLNDLDPLPGDSGQGSAHRGLVSRDALHHSRAEGEHRPVGGPSVRTVAEAVPARFGSARPGDLAEIGERDELEGPLALVGSPPATAPHATPRAPRRPARRLRPTPASATSRRVGDPRSPPVQRPPPLRGEPVERKGLGASAPWTFRGTETRRPRRSPSTDPEAGHCLRRHLRAGPRSLGADDPVRHHDHPPSWSQGRPWT